MSYNDIWKRLLATLDEREAKAASRMLLEEMFGFSLTDIVCGAVERLTEADCRRLDEAVERVAAGEPVQYVLGRAWFLERQFSVAPGVLIPRPETEELCRETIKAMEDTPHPALLDIGTGSGCIAISLALGIPGARMTAWDISTEALRIATENATALGADVEFCRQDALNPPAHAERWDAIVSNPPYICHKESNAMEQNVLGYEPHLALFVPDDEPLLFYRAIASYAASALRRDGHLLFEINPLYSHQMEEMLRRLGFGDIMTIKDSYGKDRISVCRKP